MFRCLGRSATVANRLRAQRVKEQQKAPFRSQAQLLAQLEVGVSRCNCTAELNNSAAHVKIQQTAVADCVSAFYLMRIVWR
jgi:alpha-D-ribose 1-methylphosphonate 5-triphosphate synthase subunit PhnI